MLFLQFVISGREEKRLACCSVDNNCCFERLKFKNIQVHSWNDRIKNHTIQVLASTSTLEPQDRRIAGTSTDFEIDDVMLDD
jgi:hypothetical protein